MADWLISANLAVYDVIGWWEETNEPVDAWTLSRPAPRVAIGDRFALWIGGPAAGVYATGTISKPSAPTTRTADRYWLRPPPDPVYELRLSTDLYLFDQPIYRRDLLVDPRFADALVVRMPRARNPIPLTPVQWSAIAARLPSPAARSRARRRPSTSLGAVVVTERPLGTKVEEAEYQTTQATKTQRYREARLLKAYERNLGYPLVERAAKLPTGERIVADAYDRRQHRLIEAKATTSRANVRMAIGQLLDYRRHVAQGAALAVLLPDPPNADLLALLRSHRIEVIAMHGRRFRSIR
ncbi:MAG TPA: hypothetical protein VM938_07395 [Acidimicrobiales bacterium]|nr:hypothetical protein [Acidimicrobiales bacterium]